MKIGCPGKEFEREVVGRLGELARTDLEFQPKPSEEAVSLPPRDQRTLDSLEPPQSKLIHTLEYFPLSLQIQERTKSRFAVGLTRAAGLENQRRPFLDDDLATPKTGTNPTFTKRSSIKVSIADLDKVGRGLGLDTALLSRRSGVPANSAPQSRVS